jgi:hypothetical protein
MTDLLGSPVHIPVRDPPPSFIPQDVGKAQENFKANVTGGGTGGGANYTGGYSGTETAGCL